MTVHSVILIRLISRVLWCNPLSFIRIAHLNKKRTIHCQANCCNYMHDDYVVALRKNNHLPIRNRLSFARIHRDVSPVYLQ